MRKNSVKQKLLVSVRGKNEAMEAFKGGAHIIDVEYPESALGTPYPFNIQAVRKVISKRVSVATNIGEEQAKRSTACQAALGVALAGADIVKAGLASYTFKEAEYLGRSIVRTVKEWFPKKKVVPAFFADSEFRNKFDPVKEGPRLAMTIKADGILIDTFYKDRGKNLLDLISLKELKDFVIACHRRKLEAWIAGSITKDQLPNLWPTGVDVICIRGAACDNNANDCFGKVKASIVKQLVDTLRI